MLTNIIKYAYKSVVSEKKFYLLNTIGLSIGFFGLLFLIMIIKYELSYDTYHPNHKNTFRLGSVLDVNGRLDKFALSSSELGPLMFNHFKEVTNFCRFKKFGIANIKHEDKQLANSKIYLADSSIESFYKIRFIEKGSNPLAKPNSIILSKKLADIIFDRNVDPLHKTIYINDMPLAVKGIFYNLPKNTHLTFDALISMSTLDVYNTQNIPTSVKLWNVSVYTYILTSEIEYVRANFDAFKEKYMTALGNKMNARFYPEFEVMDMIHTFSTLTYDLPRADQFGLVILMIITILIFVVITSNFLTFYLSKSINRSKEIAIKRIYGATAFDINFQIFSEILGTVLISVLLSGIVFITFFGQFDIYGIGHRNLLSLISHELLLTPILIVASAMILSFLPALLYSRLKPIESLKNKMVIGTGFIQANRILLLTHYLISLLVTIFIINLLYTKILFQNEVEFQDLKNIYILDLSKNLASNNQVKLIENDLLTMSLISDVSITNFNPENLFSEKFLIESDKLGLNDNKILSTVIKADTNIYKLLPLNLKSNSQLTYRNIVVNNILSKKLNLSKNERLGFLGDKKRYIGGSIGKNKFNFLAFHNNPTVIIHEENAGKIILVRCKKEQVHRLGTYIKNVSNKLGLAPNVELLSVYDALYKKSESYLLNIKFYVTLCIFTLILSLSATLSISKYSINKELTNLAIKNVFGISNLQLFSNLYIKFLIPIFFSTVLGISMISYINVFFINFDTLIFGFAIDGYVISVAILIQLSLVTSVIVWNFVDFNKQNIVNLLRVD